MKIRKEHFNHIKRQIEDYSRRCALAGKTPSEWYAEYKGNGLSDKRFRWDIAKASGITPFICDYLYPYLNDTHIDSALRKITNTK